MHYGEFRDRLQDVLHDVGLFSHQLEKPIETIDLAKYKPAMESLYQAGFATKLGAISLGQKDRL